MLRFIEKFLTVWADACRRGSWLVVALFFAAAALATWHAINHLKVNTDTSEMLDPDLDFQRNAFALRTAFPQIKNDLVIIARAPTLDEADAYAGALRARLLEETDLFGAVFSPAQEPFFMENGFLYLETDELETRLAQMTRAAGLIETLVKSPTTDTFFATLAENDELAERSELGVETLHDIYAELAEVIEASLAGERRPFSWMGALDTDEPDQEGYLQIVYASPVLDFTRLQPARPAVEQIRVITAELNESFGGRVEVYITGDPALRAEELESVTTGIGLSFLLSFILVTLMLVVAYRSASLAALTMVALIITLTLTSAFAAIAVGELNLVSVAFTVLLIGLGLDFAIHLLLHVQERRAADQSTMEALKGAMHEVGPALAIAAPTTALAFFSFVPTDFHGIAQLGVIAGAGVLIAFFVSVTFIPAALGALPRPRVRPAGGSVREGFKRVERISGPVSIVTIVLGLGALVLLPQARFDADPMSLRDPSSQSVRGFNLLFTEEDTIPYRLTRLVGDAAEATATVEAVRKLDTVRGTRSLPDFVPDDQDAKLELIDFAAGSLIFALDAEPEEATETGGAFALETRLKEAYTDGPGTRLALLLERSREQGGPEAEARLQSNIFRFWPPLVERLQAQLRADYVDIEILPDALTSRYLSQGGQWRVDILPVEDVRNPAALNRFVNSVEELYPDVSGGAVQTKKAGEVISASMLQATGIALAVVTLFLLALIRRILTVFLILFPLALAAALTTATGVLLNLPFNYANVIVLPLLIGIGVDSGIHLVMRQQQVKAGEGLYGTSTPRAVLFSALTTVASFGSLMLSPHRGTASMGELLSIAIAYTLICTLIVLPAAFRFGAGRGGFLQKGA